MAKLSSKVYRIGIVVSFLIEGIEIGEICPRITLSTDNFLLSPKFVKRS